MAPMTEAEYNVFLTKQARTGKLATVRVDGRPHVVPIWFDFDGETLVFTTWHTSVKAQNMQHDSRVCICVDDEKPPFAFVVIEGTVTLTANDADMLYWATRIGGRYMGADQAEAYGRRNAVTGELLVRMTPTKIIAQKNIAD